MKQQSLSVQAVEERTVGIEVVTKPLRGRRDRRWIQFRVAHHLSPIHRRDTAAPQNKRDAIHVVICAKVREMNTAPSFSMKCAGLRWKVEMIVSARRVRTAATLGTVLVNLLNPSTLLLAQSARTTSTATAASQLERIVPALMRNGGVPGMSIALIRGGKTTWVHSFGVKNTKTGEPVTSETIFEAASLSKPVFAYGVLKLVDTGKLDLDAPLTTYLPKPYIDGDDRLGKITARIVLSHRTGFPNWRGSDGKLPISFMPGTRFSYSGEGYIYLQRVVEQITGKPLNEYMTQAVFEPLGMTHSSYVWRSEFDSATATGYDEKGMPDDLWKPIEAGAASSLNTTARDYALFVDAVLNGKGLSSSTLHEMETPQVALDPECRICTMQEPKELSKNLFWGLGWGIQLENGRTAFWHWGDNGDFKAFVMADPARKSGVVMFANGKNALDIAKPVIDDAMDTDALAFAWLK